MGGERPLAQSGFVGGDQIEDGRKKPEGGESRGDHQPDRPLVAGACFTPNDALGVLRPLGELQVLDGLQDWIGAHIHRLGLLSLLLVLSLPEVFDRLGDRSKRRSEGGSGRGCSRRNLAAQGLLRKWLPGTREWTPEGLTPLPLG